MYNNPNKFQAVYDLFSDPEVKKYLLEKLAKEISIGVEFDGSNSKPKLTVSIKFDGVEVAKDSDYLFLDDFI